MKNNILPFTSKPIPTPEESDAAELHRLRAEAARAEKLARLVREKEAAGLSPEQARRVAEAQLREDEKRENSTPK